MVTQNFPANVKIKERVYHAYLSFPIKESCEVFQILCCFQQYMQSDRRVKLTYCALYMIKGRCAELHLFAYALLLRAYELAVICRKCESN